MRRKINYNFPVLTPYSNLLQDRNTRNLEKIDGRWKGKGKEKEKGKGKGKEEGKEKEEGKGKGKGKGG